MKAFLIIASLVAVLGSTAFVGDEYRSAYLFREPELDAFNALADGTAPRDLPRSSRGMREMFLACGAVQQGLVYAFQPPDRQEAVDEACERLARMALERNPTYGAAHTILMLSASREEEITEALVRSQLTAPRESWHAKLRLRVGLPLYGTGGADVDRAVEADIRFLVQSSGGRSWLARLYISDASIRPVLVGVIDTRPNGEQAAFLQEVRRLGQN